MMRIEVIETRHHQLERQLGLGVLDRLCDDDYSHAVYGATVEEVRAMPDGEIDGTAWEAICGLIGEGLIRHCGHQVSKRNTKRIISRYEAAASRESLEEKRRQLEETLGPEERKKSTFYMLLSGFSEQAAQEHQRRFEQSEGQQRPESQTTNIKPRGHLRL